MKSLKWSRSWYIQIISVLLLFLLVAPPTVTLGDGLSFTGTTLSLTLSPDGAVREGVPFNADLQLALRASLSLGGLIFTTDIVVGIAGLEHAILELSTRLGDLSFQDQFWFAAPFDSGGAKLGAPQFVKKWVTIKGSGHGITFENLAILEDVHFTDPYPAPLKEPEYRFGDILTVKGTAAGGIGIISVTGICADPDKENKVKKFEKKGTVCESGELELTVERLTLRNIRLSGLRLDQTLEFRPEEPFYAKTVLRGDLPLMHNSTFAIAGVLTDLGQISLSELSLSLKDAQIYLKLLDEEGDLDFEEVEFRFVLLLDAGFLKGKTLITPGAGMTFQELVFGISPPGSSFKTAATLSGDGSLGFESIEFALGLPLNALTLEAKASYTPTGLASAGLALVLNF